MLTRLNRLQKTMDSLDEGRLESNNKRINAIMSELDALNTKKQLLNINDENLKKVATYFEISLFYFAYKKQLNTLYENFKKIQPIGEELPGVIDRLECLKLIHEESALINDKFRVLRDLEAKLAVKLKENHEELNKVYYYYFFGGANKQCLQVSANFVQNVDTINKNIHNLEERVKKLQILCIILPDINNLRFEVIVNLH